MRIYKYMLMPTLIQELKLYKGSQIIKVGEQSEVICIWVEHPDLSSELETHTIYIIGTGHDFQSCPREDLRYLDSVFVNHFVWHVYEKDLGWSLK